MNFAVCAHKTRAFMRLQNCQCKMTTVVQIPRLHLNDVVELTNFAKDFKTQIWVRYVTHRISFMNLQLSTQLVQRRHTILFPIHVLYDTFVLLESFAQSSWKINKNYFLVKKEATFPYVVLYYPHKLNTQISVSLIEENC